MKFYHLPHSLTINSIIQLFVVSYLYVLGFFNCFLLTSFNAIKFLCQKIYQIVHLCHCLHNTQHYRNRCSLDHPSPESLTAWAQGHVKQLPSLESGHCLWQSCEMPPWGSTFPSLKRRIHVKSLDWPLLVCLAMNLKQDGCCKCSFWTLVRKFVNFHFHFIGNDMRREKERA